MKTYKCKCGDDKADEILQLTLSYPVLVSMLLLAGLLLAGEPSDLFML